MLTMMKPLLLFCGILFSSWRPTTSYDPPAKNDNILHQVTQVTQADLQVDPSSPHLPKHVGGQEGEKEELGENIIWEENLTLNDQKGNFWSTRGEHGEMRNKRQTTSNKQERIKRKEVENTNKQEKTKQKKTQRNVNTDTKRVTNERRLKEKNKEEKKKRTRMQQRKKLKKTLQEEMKRNNRIRRIMANKGRTRPNIVFILADDLGYNDVPWHNPDIKAPELLRLARQGVVLENHYASSTPLSPTGLNTSFTLLPQRLRQLGYNTHLVGKWHLGYCSWAYTPTERGFDSFYGYYLGSQTYFTRYKKLGPKKGSPFWRDQNQVLDDHNPYRGPHQDPIDSSLKHQHRLKEATKKREEEREWERQPWLTPEHNQQGGYDFRFNHKPVLNTSELYSNELYAARAEELIKSQASRGTGNPLFLMLSLQAVHGPVQNGGNIRSGGNNFPLRGSKGGVFEGGTRGVAFIHSPLLPRTGYKYTGMMHVVDWYNTLLHAAHGTPSTGDENRTPLQDDEPQEEDLPTWAKFSSFMGHMGVVNSTMGGEEEDESGKNDSVDLWSAILDNRESPRSSFVYNVRKRPLRGAIRRKNWKLVVGDGGRYDGWVPPSDVAGGVSTRCCSSWHARTPAHNVMLYNLKDDPLETTNVASLRPDVAANLQAQLRSYAFQSRHPHSPQDDPRGHPNLHGGFFSPGWCQPIV
ncbi:Arylsulfatase J-like [Homarus americanus]|uniref:Arylsulfatase J-like n=1 Tax=Homarus americanus TaxID=6706 RepID=A0A8J5N3A0_HOMAM|nr:Arylsulfatase J-like [Homarus americanus]